MSSFQKPEKGDFGEGPVRRTSTLLDLFCTVLDGSHASGWPRRPRSCSY